MKPLHIFLIAIIVIILFGLLLPNGIRAAIANNLWSVQFIKGAYAQDGVDPQSFSPPATHPHAGMLLAHRALEQDQLDLALSLITNPNSPSDPLSLNTLAQIRFRQGDYAEALEIWRKINDAGSLNFAGIVLAENGEIDLAIRAYQYAVEVRPDDQVYQDRLVGHMLAKADALLKANQLTQAIDAYRVIVSQFPGYIRAYEGLARAYWQNDQTEMAYQILEAGWELDSDNFLFYMTAARIYEDGGKLDRALMAYQKAAAIKPGSQDAIEGVERLSGTDD